MYILMFKIYFEGVKFAHTHNRTPQTQFYFILKLHPYILEYINIPFLEIFSRLMNQYTSMYTNKMDSQSISIAYVLSDTQSYSPS